MKLLHFFLCILFLNTTSLFCSEQNTVQAIVLAAGKSSRFGTDYTKMCAPICGKPMLLHVIAPLIELAMPITIVVGHKKEVVIDMVTKENIPQVTFAKQTERLGTGHALLCTKPFWDANHILILNGDMPLVTSKIIEQLLQKHIDTNSAASIVTSYCIDPTIAYGRIVLTENGFEIIETKHFTQDIKDYPYVNAGIYIFKRSFLEDFIHKVQQNSVTGEFYITDLLKIACDNEYTIATTIAPFKDIHGVNTLKQLAYIENIKRNELLHTFMEKGVRFILPETTLIDYNVAIGKNSIIHSGVQLRNGTIIGKNCTIEPYCILDGVIIADNTRIQPYTHATN